MPADAPKMSGIRGEMIERKTFVSHGSNDSAEGKRYAHHRSSRVELDFGKVVSISISESLSERGKRADRKEPSKDRDETGLVTGSHTDAFCKVHQRVTMDKYTPNDRRH